MLHWLRRTRQVSADLRRGFSYGSTVLREPVTYESAVASIRARLRTRAGRFLDTVERTIFGNPNSPYRPLLDHAGYDFAGLRALVLQEGVEPALRRLRDDGVYLSVEEFKGLREARRGACTLRFGEDDFRNPLVRSGFPTVSGTRPRAGTRSLVPATEPRIRAEHFAVTFAAYGVERLPVAVWYPEMERSSLLNILALTVMGRVPERWFSQLPGWRLSNVDETRAFYIGVHLAARRRGLKIPLRTYVPFTKEAEGLRWVSQQTLRRGCVVITSPSAAVRLALAAKRAHTRLDNVTFITGAEALTGAKAATIGSVGAQARPRFSFQEFGTAGRGCASPVGPDDMHLHTDIVAAVQRRRLADRLGSEVDAFLFTSLQPEARRTLLNVESGDYGRLVNRRCGCLLEQIGWTEHIMEVRSFEKLTLESWAFLGSKLVELVEERLPNRFGGDLTDYQLVEHEDKDGQTRLTLLVHPRLGPIDQPAVLDCVEEALNVSRDWVKARVFRRLETLQIRRAAPMPTRAGKMMSLHHLGPEQTIGAPRVDWG